MLRKLLKYDLRAMFKYWFISALASVGISVLAGIVALALRTMDSSKHEGFYSLLVLGEVLCVIALGIIAILVPVFILIRLYRSFFSDEGYLTFTLPVRRETLLQSKLIASFLLSLATGVLYLFNAFLFFAIFETDIVFSARVWREIGRAITEISAEIGAGYLVLYLLEGIMISIAVSLVSILVIFLCMTISSVITKKHRVLVAIGLYYAFHTVVSFAAQIFIFSGAIGTLFEQMERLSRAGGLFAVFVGLLLAVALLASVFFGLYWIEICLLERKWKLA